MVSSSLSSVPCLPMSQLPASDVSTPALMEATSRLDVKSVITNFMTLLLVPWLDKPTELDFMQVSSAGGSSLLQFDFGPWDSHWAVPMRRASTKARCKQDA